jgi:SAM-dependent methyltransferase
VSLHPEPALLRLTGKARLYRLVQAASRQIAAAGGATHAGLWLGVLDRGDLHALDQARYAAAAAYRQDAHNLRGLFDWERRALDAHFPATGSLLVLGAGGGREVLALARLLYEVTGYECNPALLRYGRQLLVRTGCAGAELHGVARDLASPDAGCYDGVIVGWSAYALIPGRRQRVALLAGLRPRLPSGAPILVSFFSRPEDSGRERVVTAVANTVRRLRGAAPIEPGDDLTPDFVHRFTREEVASELLAGGFRLREFEPQGPGPYDSGFAVGTACGPAPVRCRPATD